MTGPYPEPPPQYGPPPSYGPPPGFPPPPPARRGNRGVVIAIVSVLGALAVLCAAGIVGVAWFVTRAHDDTSGSVSGGGGGGGPDIAGLIDYRKTHPEWLERDHRPQDEKIEYPMTPAAGGPHHPIWKRCAGDVYPAPVDEGNAVHSLEHGAVWITYRPGLAAGDVTKLAGKVRNNDFMLMSPYPEQPSPISLQAWGYQLRVDSVGDPRIDAFIKAFRETATMEAGVPCSTGADDDTASATPTA